MTILIVDDSENNLRVLRLLLERDSYQAVTAADGAEALAGAPARLPAAMPAEEDVVYLKHYNAVLIRQLEHQTEQLKCVNRKLEQDITGRKRAEEALRLQAERLQILHEMDQGILAAQSLGAIAEAALDKLVRLVP